MSTGPGRGRDAVNRRSKSLRAAARPAGTAKRNVRNNELIDGVLVALRRITRANDIRSREITKLTGLTTAQLVVLRAIAKLGEVTTRIISDEVSLSPATVTTIMDRLSERGFVERYRSEFDRRAVHTRLTGKGRKTLSQAPKLVQELFSKRFAQLPLVEQRGIVATLRRVASMMDPVAMDGESIAAGNDIRRRLPAAPTATSP